MVGRLPDWNSIKGKAKEYERQIEDYGINPAVAKAVGLVLLSSLSTLAVIGLRKRYWRRLQNSEDIPLNVLRKKRWIKGVVTRVGDGDNFRLYHTPGLFWRWPLKFRSIPTERKALTDQTIHIRMAGVDAPEMPHFGSTGQKYAPEARQWLEDTLLGKRVWCQLIARDQYKRTVAIPCLPIFGIPGRIYRGRNVSLMMISNGWGVTYTQIGAEYGKAGIDKYRKAEAKAKAARRGQWVDGVGESPSEYKRRIAASGAGATASPTAEASPPPKRGILSRLFSRNS